MIYAPNRDWARAVLYLRVSTLDQTTANQERKLRDLAGRMGCNIVHIYKDHGIGGAKGRDKRPAFDRPCRDAAKLQFDMVMAWSVDRLGRSLQDLVPFSRPWATSSAPARSAISACRTTRAGALRKSAPSATGLASTARW